MTWRRAIGPLATAMLAAGLLLLAHVFYVEVDSAWFRIKERQRLARASRDAEVLSRRETSAAPSVAYVPPPIPRRYADGESIGAIKIPRLGLDVIVGEGDSTLTLRRGAGHLTGTALPGVLGNVVIAGHRDTVFRPLKDVKPGDLIVVATPQGRFEYRVESTQVVLPSAVEVLEPRGGATLTLITCFPFYYVGAAPKRFIVMARASEREAP